MSFTHLTDEGEQTASCGPPALLTLTLIRRFYVPAAERTLYRWIACGIFPQPDVRLGGKVRYWRRATVEAWIESLTHANAG